MDLQDALKKPKEKVSAEKKGFYERPALANKNTACPVKRKGHTILQWQQQTVSNNKMVLRMTKTTAPVSAIPIKWTRMAME